MATNPILGEIRLFAGNFAPRGYAFCNGQTLSIAQNVALFSLLGTFYGGNGTSTFQLPDLQGRSPIGMGNGLGLSPFVIGEAGGSENVSIQIPNLPSHTHTASAPAPVPTRAPPRRPGPAPFPRG